MLEEVESGERVVISRWGKPVAVLAPYGEATVRRRLGLFKDQARIVKDFDELPADLAASFGMTPP